MYTNKTRKNSLVYRSLLTSPILLLVSLVILPPDSALAKITKGPVLLRVYQNRAAVMWETDTEGPGKLSYGNGQKTELEKYVVTSPEKVEYEIQKDPNTTVKKTALIHKLWLENLQPGRSYFYRIIDSESKSDFYSFRTVPADTNEVTFVVYGDSRTHPKTHRKIVEQIAKKNIDFIVHTGDLVTDGDHYDQWGPQFFEPLKDLAEFVPVYAVIGNHDLSEQKYFEKLLIPQDEKTDFAFDYGPLRYICIDNASEAVEAEQALNRITADAQSSKAQWKFISYHKPSLNFGGHRSDWGSPEVFGGFADAGVDFVITGHSHQYERFRPVTPPRLLVADKRGGSFVTYITSGGGGAPLHDVKPAVYHAQAKKIHHFCWFHIKGNKLTMDTIDINGNIIDHLEVAKIDGKLNREYLETAVPAEAVRSHRDLHKP